MSPDASVRDSLVNKSTDMVLSCTARSFSAAGVCGREPRLQGVAAHRGRMPLLLDWGPGAAIQDLEEQKRIHHGRIPLISVAVEHVGYWRYVCWVSRYRYNN